MSSNWGSNSSGCSFRSDVENSFDAEELLQIGTRCRQLRKEKEMLRESQSQSVELRLELSANSLSESRLEDKRRIQMMEKQVLNCYQEIDYLRDQVNLRGKEANYLIERVLDLEFKVTQSGNLEEEVNFLREDLCTSKSEQLSLLQSLKSAETELQLSVFSVEKLEESISSLTLESQCEIESMRLDIAALEQALFDAKKVQGESIQERDKLRETVEELRFKSQEAQEKAKCLEKQNKELRERCAASERNMGEFCQSFKEQLESESEAPVNAECFFAELSRVLPVPDESRECFHGIMKRLEVFQDAKSRDKREDMARQIRGQYKELVQELKDELKEEKLKAREEAEELTQEMAELRYKMTCLLEEECKRRACIEQASLQRIANLETQIKREKNKSSTCIIPLSSV